MKRSSAFVSMLLAVGCAAATPPPEVTYHPGRTDQPVAFDTLDQPFDLSQIEALGASIYELDRAAAIAWDHLLSSGLANQISAIGYLPTRTDAGFAVLYVTETGTVVAEVTLGSEFDSPIAQTSERALSGLQLELWKAREAALHETFRACTPNYNVVVLHSPLEARPGWLVYLLAATTDPDLLILGGHYRIWVSRDFVVEATEPLSRGCPIAKRDPTAVSQAISNFGIERPLETHVFTSLLYSMRLSVFNEEHAWEIEGGRLRQTE